MSFNLTWCCLDTNNYNSNIDFNNESQILFHTYKHTVN